MARPEIRDEMHKIAEKRRRFGYRRVGILLERKGMIMNEKKLYRIYREEGLSVRRRRGRKRARGSRTPMPVPLRPNQRWSLDFLSDTFGVCRKFRILAVNDDCCRENLALIADTSISGARVARELDALVRIYGKPACIVSYNGTEFTSKAILKWANENGVEWHYMALLRKSADDRTSPFPGHTYPAATVIGIPSAVKRLRTAARIWTSATWRSKSRDINRWPSSFTQFIFVSTLLRR